MLLPPVRYGGLRDPQCGHLLLYLPGRPVVVDVCVTHPLAFSAVAAATRGGTAAECSAKANVVPCGTARTCRHVPVRHPLQKNKYIYIYIYISGITFRSPLINFVFQIVSMFHKNQMFMKYLSVEMFGGVGPPAVALLHATAECAAPTGANPKDIFVESTARNRSTTPCRGTARQVPASAPLRSCLDGRHVRPGRPVA